MENIQTYRAVRFDKYGGPDVLHLSVLDLPVPAKGQVLVKVKAAGINTGETAEREGAFASIWPWPLPSGQGTDFAGIVETPGEDVVTFKKGDAVIGFTQKRDSQAEYVLAEADALVLKPAHVSWQEGGALFMVGTTAYGAIKAVSLKKGETVVVSAAAGGVGSVVIQLAGLIGARIIGIASEANHDWLKKHGVIPVAYGQDLATRVKQAAGGKIDAFIDCFGKGYVELAVQLGVPAEKIDTLIDFEAAKKYSVKTDGSDVAATQEVLQELTNDVDQGKLEIPIAKVYPLTQVREAFEELEKRHTHGKIVLVP